MTELETLFIRNNRQLRNDIAAAVEAEDVAALTKYQEELDYEVKYSAHLSWRARLNGVLVLDTKEDAEALVDGEYDLEATQTKRWRSITRRTSFGTTTAMRMKSASTTSNCATLPQKQRN